MKVTSYAIWRLKSGSTMQYEQFGYVDVEQIEQFTKVGELLTWSNRAGEFLPPTESEIYFERTASGLEQRQGTLVTKKPTQPEPAVPFNPLEISVAA